jgi:hypothetical protein
LQVIIAGEAVSKTSAETVEAELGKMKPPIPSSPWLPPRPPPAKIGALYSLPSG